MVVRKTINLLPEVLKTETNKKFLNATLDQLITEPNLQPINGYVGRASAPGFKNFFEYVTEPDKNRTVYQLEPTVVARDSSGDVDLSVTYPELLDKINYYGGITKNPNRLFSNEYYSYDPKINLDALVNFNQYYWLTDGPSNVSVQSETVDFEANFSPVYDEVLGVYYFDELKTDFNIDITLARGGTYKFKIIDRHEFDGDNDTEGFDGGARFDYSPTGERETAAGGRFWIQTEPGVDGISNDDNNISTREILGVENNGADAGVITFRVPQSDAQSYFTTLTKNGDVDLVTELPFSQIANQTLSSIDDVDGIDGQKAFSQINNKTIVFANNSTDPTDWQPFGVFEELSFDTSGSYFDTTTGQVLERMSIDGQDNFVLNANVRHDVWRITLEPITEIIDGETVTIDSIIRLSYERSIGANEKVDVQGGAKNRNTSWYKNAKGDFFKVPLITATLDRLYYQSDLSPTGYGIIRLVDQQRSFINVESEILGRENYTSPNGVKFINGLKIKFTGDTIPSSYQDKEFYVEGVGRSIRLANVEDLFYSRDTESEDVPDYIIINRGSVDLNPWSRRNRWFHYNVILDTAKYNRTAPVFTQESKAQRPIIEFDYDLELYNFGRIGMKPVDIIDTVNTNPSSNIEGAVTATDGAGTTYQNGHRVIFINDIDPETRNKVWRIQYSTTTAGQANTIHLVDTGEYARVNNTVRATVSTNKETIFWYNGINWITGQSKNSLNQEPLFNVVDADGISFGDTSAYPATTFTGTKIFNYKRGSGSADSVLGWSLSYRNLVTSGDIQFYNSYESDTFTYSNNEITTAVKINQGKLQRIQPDGTTTNVVPWVKISEKSKQFQRIIYAYDGSTSTFKIDVPIEPNKVFKNLYVYVNQKEISETDYLVTMFENDHVNVDIEPSLMTAGDRVDLLFYSDQRSTFGYYEIPQNLSFNGLNSVITNITLGEMRNHSSVLAKSDFRISGTFPGINNSRDIYINNNPGTILQHSASLGLPSLFLSSEKYNFVNSVRTAAQEYTKFKNKLLTLSLTGDYLNMEPATALDQLLKAINLPKDSSFPWFRSDMLPYGDDKTIITYTILDTQIRSYQISEIFINTLPQSRGLLIYHTEVNTGETHQLVVNRDYSINQKAPLVELLRIDEYVDLSAGDTLTIFIYKDTNGSYIPETPSKLGLYPKFIPEIYTDFNYSTPTTFIRGHDGSLTPSFGDFRDAILLEFERRIYNNIKVEYSEDLINITDIKPGKFRTNEYRLDEINHILSNEFLNWAGSNIVNYSLNDTYDDQNFLTYNFNRATDLIDGENLPGSWRAIFQYFYDTQSPNYRPWEMLGISEEPRWWEDEYGPAPYTSDNTLMWEDLENGRIKQGNRAGIDDRFKRPGLKNFIPVDREGNLTNPLTTLVDKFNKETFANTPWSIGDWGPAETAWRNSSVFPYAAQIIYALAYPVKYFNLGISVERYRYDEELNQYVVKETNRCITAADIVFNDETYTASYINWILDYLTAQGIVDKSDFKTFVSNYNIQLSYRMAGFSDKRKLKVIAEQYSPSSTNAGVVIPDDNYDLNLHKSTPLENVRYSAVIIEKQADGYSVGGYDLNSPYFNINIPVQNSDSYTVKVLKTGVYYPRDFTKTVKSIPYGTKFTTEQEVAEFLAGYEYNLKLSGFRFETYNPELIEICDWLLSTKEFLFWSQQGWQPGNILVLSPVSNKIKYANPTAVVDEISNTRFDTKLMNQNFSTLNNNDYTVSRIDNEFVLTLSNPTDMIGLLSIATVQYEHIMLFDNITDFNDIIYDPSTGQRQLRLKLIGMKTGDWTGSLSAPGYMYNSGKIDNWQSFKDYFRGDLVEYKNFYYAAKTNLIGSDTFNFEDWIKVTYDKYKAGLIPNFSTIAAQAENFYNIDKYNSEDNFDKYALGLIGFRTRDYLTNLGFDDTTQAKFYQGYIHEKGSMNSLNTITKLSQSEDLENKIDIYEDWAFRVGSYGSLDTNRFIEIELNEVYAYNNPVQVTVTNTGNVVYNNGETENSIYKISTENLELPLIQYRNELSDYSEDVHTAGPVDLDQIELTIFDLNSSTISADILNDLEVGDNLWTAKDFDQKWNVFKVAATNANIVRISKLLDRQLVIDIDQSRQVAENDIIIIRGIETFTSVYRVESLLTESSFIVTYVGEEDISSFVSADFENIPLLKLDSIKVNYLTDISDMTTIKWNVGDIVWVDNQDDNYWAGYRKEEPWRANSAIQPTTAVNSAYVGYSVSSNPQGNIVVTGAPGASSTGNVVVFTKNVGNVLVESYNSSTSVKDISGLGTSIAVSSNVVIAGAPASGNARGYAVVYSLSNVGGLSHRQVLTINSANAALFGQSIAMSNDSKWLYIGAPGINNVYVYGYSESPANLTTVFSSNAVANAASANNTLTLSFTPSNIDLLTVQDGSYIYVPYKDFTVNQANIIFNYSLTTHSGRGNLTVTQNSGYSLFTVINGQNNSEFGYSISTSSAGTTLLIGAPSTIINGQQDSGIFYIYDRSAENILVSNGTTPVVNTVYPLDNTKLNLYTVCVNGIACPTNAYVVSGNTITFNGNIDPGSIVTVDTNQFNLIDVLDDDDSQENARLGHTVAISDDETAIYVSAPYYTDGSKFEVGEIHRYISESRIYGSITGVVENPNVTVGDIIRINHFPVEFTGNTLQSVVSDINNAGIPGIIASVSNNRLSISSDSAITYDRLQINQYRTLGNTSALSSLGLIPYVESEIISNPTPRSYDRFGMTLDVSEDSNLLAVGSKYAVTELKTTFDIYSEILNPNVDVYATNVNGNKNDHATTYDGGTTTFTEVIQSGGVWVHQQIQDVRNDPAHPNKIVYVQQVTPSDIGISLLEESHFGSGLSFSGRELMVGVSQESRRFTGNTQRHHGGIYKFNSNGLNGWDLVSEKQQETDPRSILKAYLYNKINNEVITYLDYIDPIKGKILGVAEQELTYKTDYDPAVYNTGFDNFVSQDSNLFWSIQQVGELWWDLSKVRYLNYEQQDLLYKNKKWGQMFPGSEIKVYEWVESNYPPSQYTGEGTPKNVNAYSILNFVDPVTNLAIVKYYFWVTNKETVPAGKKRSLSTTTVEKYISDPLSTGIKYIAPLEGNSIAIYNIKNDVVGKNTILHLDYRLNNNENLIHNEYTLLSERGTKTSLLPVSLYNKLVDSLSGVDINNNPVPATNLTTQNRYGIGTRPAQTMFVDRVAALKEMSTYVNNIFKSTPIIVNYNIEKLKQGEPKPLGDGGEFIATEVTKSALNSHINNYLIGDSVLVSADETYENAPVIYKKTTNTTWTLQTLQYAVTVETYAELSYLTSSAGTVVMVNADEKNGNLWSLYLRTSTNTWRLVKSQSYKTSDFWDYADWYATGFDSTTAPTFTISNPSLLATLQVSVGDTVKILNTGSGNWSLLQFNSVGYTVVGLNRGTIQLNERLYNQTRYKQEIRIILNALYEDIFVNDLDEKFVELFFVFINYILYEQRTVDWVFKTSFISIVHRLSTLTQSPVYRRNTQDDYRSYVEEIKPYRTSIREYVYNYQRTDDAIVKTSDFDVPPFYDEETGLFRSPVTSANILDAGNNSAFADTLTSSIYQDWVNNHGYYVRNILIAPNDEIFIDRPSFVITGSLTGDDAKATAILANGRISSVLITYPGSGYYTTPTVSVFRNTERAAVKAHAELSNDTVRKIKTTLVYDRVTYNSNIRDWSPNTNYSANSLITYSGQLYSVSNAFTSGSFFSYSNLVAQTSNVISNANDRIFAYYNPAYGLPGRDLELLQGGIDYPGTTVLGPRFTEGNKITNPEGALVLDVDTSVDAVINGGTYNNPAQTGDADVVVDGGKFIDTYGSHAPEELLPGRVYDTLMMTVTTANVDPTGTSYTEWLQRRGFFIKDIIVTNSGAGYTKDGTNPVRVTTTTGVLNLNLSPNEIDLDENGRITRLRLITSTSYGFLQTPIVNILGSNSSPASATVTLEQREWRENTFSYRVFKSMNYEDIMDRRLHGQPETEITDHHKFYRANQQDRTTLVSTLAATDIGPNVTITVANGALLPNPVINYTTVNNVKSLTANTQPGVMYVNGERITYWTKTGNVISNISRGTAGTSIATHPTGSYAYSLGAAVDLGSLVNSDLEFDVEVLTNTDQTVIDKRFIKRFAQLDLNKFTLLAGTRYVRTRLFNDTGLVDDVIITEQDEEEITTESGERITVENQVQSPANERGLFNSNNAIARFIKTVS